VRADGREEHVSNGEIGVATVEAGGSRELARRAQTTAETMLRDVVELPVDTEEDLAFAAEMLFEVKGQAKNLETMRKKATGPMRAAIKEVDGWFKPATTALQAIEAEVKARMAAGRRRLDEDHAATAAAAAEVASGADTVEEAVAALAVAVEEGAPVKVEGVSFREAWELEVVDEAEVPREYLVPDLPTLREMARRLKCDFAVPGCRAVRRDVVASRSR
jgi:hypothetical protein